MGFHVVVFVVISDGDTLGKWPTATAMNRTMLSCFIFLGSRVETQVIVSCPFKSPSLQLIVTVKQTLVEVLGPFEAVLCFIEWMVIK